MQLTWNRSSLLATLMAVLVGLMLYGMSLTARDTNAAAQLGTPAASPVASPAATPLATPIS